MIIEIFFCIIETNLFPQSLVMSEYESTKKHVETDIRGREQGITHICLCEVTG